MRTWLQKNVLLREFALVAFFFLRRLLDERKCKSFAQCHTVLVIFTLSLCDRRRPFHGLKLL